MAETSRYPATGPGSWEEHFNRWAPAQWGQASHVQPDLIAGGNHAVEDVAATQLAPFLVSDFEAARRAAAEAAEQPSPDTQGSLGSALNSSVAVQLELCNHKTATAMHPSLPYVV